MTKRMNKKFIRGLKSYFGSSPFTTHQALHSGTR